MLTVLIAVLLVAYANGANDNFKGVATLFGSGTTDYRKALSWATATTLSGSIAALFLATRLVRTFTGKGLVPDAVIGNPAFLAAVALGAGLTVLLAARFGIPISTTHGLTGALVGAGFIAIGGELGFTTLGKNFLMPLIASPFMALVLTTAVYFVMHKARKTLGITRKSCLCVGEKVIPLADLGLENGQMFTSTEITLPEVFVGNEKSCKAKAIEIYEGKMFGVNAQSVLDFFHFLSAGAVSFARGLNDTPKIVALLVASSALGLTWNVGFVALAMAVGGILGARKVAETVSHKITYMNHGQGLAANLVTAILVIFASQWGMPVSTTHVSCGALFGIGLVNGKARWNVISSILGAWFLTLPVAAFFSAASFILLSRIGA
ncbi:MAG: inorganic phosphate transporter [Candidatus Omnitrophica bacterium]|nr:inorganic phosphate transporter [Candidatus Omnitrophota bacterium]